ncbi:kyphoscoliosis peptidase [Corythoichthys intestinalis]|uniref:kyphoscoliosis peptidase n=1 Tax=Corythoichthys intestinalis TaxID=161448 RepID=UPI0025A4DBCE|nr:kyphoscoliosis peptidase [Corythoichthys intestinalis]
MSAEVGIQKFSFPFTRATRQDEGRVHVKAPPLAAAEAEDQRPVAKRQLSSESAAGGSAAAVKKSAVRTEEPRGDPGTRVVVKGPSAKRKKRKELFASTDVFHRVDSHVIRAGAELKEKGVSDVADIVRGIACVAASPLEKIRAVWLWLCHNIEYDVSGYMGRSEKLSSPEDVIASGRGVCSGYSGLCLEMCRLLGIQCQEVAGHSKGIGYRQGQCLREVKSDHLWNAVFLEGQWFLMDACWGAGRVDVEHQSFVKRLDDFYFLTEPEEFIESHFPDEERWQLLEKPITLEDFQRRVFKTSAFFQMGLSLIRPLHSHLFTERGEASISLGFSQPVAFTYEMTPQRDFLHCGALERKESGPTSSGLLTLSRRRMDLRVLPPAAGAYDLRLYARPDSASGLLSWVCSFTLECSEPRSAEEIPENPYLSWGLLPGVKAMGVVAAEPGGEAAETEDGRLELRLKTSRSLMMLCELVHPKLEAGVTKRCLACQIQPDLLTCNVACPAPGSYRLSVFVRDYEETDGRFQNAANFLLRCRGRTVSQDQLFPPDLSSWCGPGTRASEAGLCEFSHQGALVSAPQGKCNITFRNRRDLELYATLNRAEEGPASAFPLARHLFSTHVDGKVTLSASLPGPGTYRLGLYARIAPGGDFKPVCDFVLRNVCERNRLPFPHVYAAWKKGCVLLEPRAGLLDASSRLCFRVKVPGARRVCVVGRGRTELQLNKSRVWEGEVSGEEGAAQLKLVADSGDSADMAVLMTFDVRKTE